MIRNPAEFFLFKYYIDSAWRDIGDAIIARLAKRIREDDEF